METITLEQASLIAEIVGVFVIILSLIYLALQVRQNTRSTRLETVQAISTEFNTWMDMIASNRETAETFHRGMFDFQNLGETGKLQFTFTASRAFRTFHEMYFQWRERALDAEIWQAWTLQIADAMQYPGFQEIWSRRRHHYTEGFQSFVDKLMVESKDTKSLYDAPSS